MSALVELKEAREQIKAAEKVLSEKAASAVNEALKEVFADEKVQVVRFAVKESEYNDEGMYPGVHGPYISEDENDLDDEDNYPSWLYDYNSSTDPRGEGLKEVLNAVGEEVLSDIYGDEYIVTAYRGKDGIRVTKDYAGW